MIESRGIGGRYGRHVRRADRLIALHMGNMLESEVGFAPCDKVKLSDSY